MTSEIVLMNRSAVAMAADSATTVTYWDKGHREHRFFKGANKIFNLSKNHPVGVMTYNAADLQGMPWEVIIKSFRDVSDGKSHDLLSGYPSGLFDFIVTQGHLFPDQQQEENFLDQVTDAAYRFAVVVRESGEVKAASTPKEKVEAGKREVEKFREIIFSDALIGSVTDEFVGALCEKYGAAAKKYIKENVLADIDDELVPIFDLDGLVKVACRAVFTRNWTTLSATGLVFSGFGDKQFFPHVEHYYCYGLVAGRLVFDKLDDKCCAISHANVSEIMPIAQSDMVKTFMFGASPKVLEEVDKCFGASLASLCDELRKAGLLKGDADVSTHVDDAWNYFKTQTVTHLAEAHGEPLRRIIGMLPISELAELAETLISMESLKERVTRPTESVSGPIDVAVISKSDGFIWIKRKHYFEPKYNPRYVAKTKG